jgi:type III secretion protein U
MSDLHASLRIRMHALTFPEIVCDGCESTGGTMSEKTEEPTESKLRQSREEGQAAKSTDVAVAFVTTAVVGTLLGTGEGIKDRIRVIISQGLDFAIPDIGEDILYKRIAAMFMEAGLAILPLVVISMMFGAIGVAAQIGFQITPKALAPKFDAINPAQGIKKVFSVKSIMTFLQMLVKAIVIGYVMWSAIVALLPLISGAVFQTPTAIGIIAWASIKKLLLYAVGLFILLGPLDYALQHHFFMKGQKMSKDDIKREYKGQEGDPEVKGQRKQLAHELANEGPPKKQVAKADAVVVNPQHYAVAIRYRADEAGVPVVLAKGLDANALKLREYAEEQNVPVFTHPPLARALHNVPINGPVPDDMFEAVAVVLRWVNEIGDKRDQPPS